MNKKYQSETQIDFLSKISHDIRTPLNGILGMAAIASANVHNHEKVTECLDKIIFSGKQLLNFVNDILDIRSLEDNHISLNEKYFNIVNLINNTIMVLQPAIDEKNHNFAFHHEDIIHPEVLGDSLKIQRIILNIVNNSIKYTNPNGQLHLYLKEKTLHNTSLFCYELILTDNGIGMSEDFLKKIFIPFEREHNPSTTTKEGTGLGMSITKKLIEMLKGSIHIESKLNYGTKITITLSLKPGNNNVPLLLNNDVATSSKNLTLNLSGKNILIAEDDELSMEIMQEILNKTNANITIASTGNEVIEKYVAAKDGFYDLILMDVEMPYMNGYETTSKIRSLHKNDSASIPIIAMTAYSFAEDCNKAISSGMNGHISKPIEMAAFMHTLAKYLH